MTAAPSRRMRARIGFMMLAFMEVLKSKGVLHCGKVTYTG